MTNNTQEYNIPAGHSPYGCADMAGNVSEWCRSLYRPYPYQAKDDRDDPQASDSRVLRGGAWNSGPGLVRCAYRAGALPDYWSISRDGFRVARDPLG